MCEEQNCSHYSCAIVPPPPSLCLRWILDGYHVVLFWCILLLLLYIGVNVAWIPILLVWSSTCAISHYCFFFFLYNFIPTFQTCGIKNLFIYLIFKHYLFIYFYSAWLRVALLYTACHPQNFTRGRCGNVVSIYRHSKKKKASNSHFGFHQIANKKKKKYFIDCILFLLAWLLSRAAPQDVK